jgi:hypothetical protein
MSLLHRLVNLNKREKGSKAISCGIRVASDISRNVIFHRIETS